MQQGDRKADLWFRSGGNFDRGRRGVQLPLKLALLFHHLAVLLAVKIPLALRLELLHLVFVLPLHLNLVEGLLNILEA